MGGNKLAKLAKLTKVTPRGAGAGGNHGNSTVAAMPSVRGDGPGRQAGSGRLRGALAEGRRGAATVPTVRVCG